jgi:membrane protein implicated in regulation of membrane protease activity
MAFQPFEVAMAMAILVLALEMLTGAFVFLSFSTALFAVTGAEVFFRDFSFKRDVLIFATVSVATFIGLRLAFRTKGDTMITKNDINDY